MSKRSDKPTMPRWAGLLAMALGAVMLSPAAFAGTLRNSASNSAGGATGGTFLSAYFDFGAGDNLLRLENPTAANGNLCAMIYVFNTSERMGECCGCLLTPNELLESSIKTVLGTGWGFGGGPPSSGVIQIVTAMPNNNRQCSPQQAYSVTPTLDGWVTHPQTLASISTLTEVPLKDNGSADPVEAASLIGDCGAILGNGSGTGSCTCPIFE